MKIALTPKPPYSWNEYNLKVLNVNISNNDDLKFFGILINVNDCDISQKEYLDCTSLEDVTTSESIKILAYLEECRKPRFYSNGDICSDILRIANYESQNTTIKTKFKIDWFMSGERLNASIDICLMQEGRIVLLVEENISFKRRRDIEPQILAKAIAVFQHNKKLSKNQRREIPKSLIFPVIVFTGTNPWFYIIKVTSSLSNGIKIGNYSRSRVHYIEYFDPKLDTCLNLNDIISRKKLYRYLTLFRDLFDSEFVYKGSLVSSINS